VHAESEELTRGLAERMTTRTVRAFLDSRPVVAELEAIQRALLLAKEAGASLHIVHVSCGRAVALAAEAWAQGADVSIETCPHYLFFTEEDVERLGAIAKCAPPLRTESDRGGLWHELARGRVHIVASDHSPAPPSMKTGDFIAAWGGIAGVQSTLAVLLDAGHHQRALPLERISTLLATQPARRFRMRSKGLVAPGMDADVALVDLNQSVTLAKGDLHQRHPLTPYLGHSFRGAVRQTIRRGVTIFKDGRITATSGGALVRPS
jgi:allantoinase